MNDSKHFLPSIIDELYHRNNLTSNLAECSFSILKRTSQWTKHPIVTNIENMERRSVILLKKSINTNNIFIPSVFSDCVDECIGKIALNHLKTEFQEIISIEPNEKCKCNLKTTRLPCHHILMNGFKEKINIPIEYHRFKCNLLNEMKESMFCN